MKPFRQIEGNIFALAVAVWFIYLTVKVAEYVRAWPFH